MNNSTGGWGIGGIYKKTNVDLRDILSQIIITLNIYLLLSLNELYPIDFLSSFGQ